MAAEAAAWERWSSRRSSTERLYERGTAQPSAPLASPPPSISFILFSLFVQVAVDVL